MVQAMAIELIGTKSLQNMPPIRSMFFCFHYNCNAQQHVYTLHQLLYNVIYIGNLIGVDKSDSSRLLP